jgi:hypothetical protein
MSRPAQDTAAGADREGTFLGWLLAHVPAGAADDASGIRINGEVMACTAW